MTKLLVFLIYSLVFVLASPLYLVVYILVFLIDGSPVIFKQERVGINQTRFYLYKFRSMRINSHIIKDGLAVSENDNRLTKLGSFLRKSSLDEIPQIINLIKFDINLVGPRAMLPEQLPYLSQIQKNRFLVRPGLVGYATIKGRASIPWSKRIHYDLLYVQKKNFLLDIYILFKSIPLVLSGSNVYYDHKKNGPAFDLTSPDNLPQAKSSEIN
ncbi:sugar transferase [Synechococcus sp. UW140]|uniref:sugar transferase n=1 Tax=Synechococcus sp. UW140 TaxID=368503 RepID=UPI000E0ECEA9|nr:sugar transferase [Synechococcus sp. UW140]